MTKDNEREINKIARELADWLFTNGSGKRAFRLVLVDVEGKDLGGLADFAVESEIRAALIRRLKAGEATAALVRKPTGGK